MAEKQPPIILRSDEIHRCIMNKYPQPAWVVLGEVRDGTGYGACRSADAIAFGVWPSRGLQVIGFEVKVSRSDWLRELKDPAKAEVIGNHCDQWFLVTAEGVAKLEEIPSTWGWYVANEKGLRLEKAPKDLDPKEIGRSFLMSIVRNISKNYTSHVAIDDRVKAEVESALKRRRSDDAYSLERARELTKKVDAFKTASGIDLDNEYTFPAKTVGEIVRAVLDWRLDRHVANVAEAAQKAQEAMTLIQELPVFKNLAAERLSRKK